MKRLALALALSACGAPDYLLVDERFSPVEEEAIRFAAGDWQLATGRRIDLVFGQRVDTDKTSITSSIIRVTSRDPVVYESGAPESDGFAGRSAFNSRVMIVVDTVHVDAVYFDYPYPDIFRHVLQHELGHWLGVGHVNSPTAVMRPMIGPGAKFRGCITAADAARYCSVTPGCRPDTMHGCAN